MTTAHTRALVRVYLVKEFSDYKLFSTGLNYCKSVALTSTAYATNSHFAGTPYVGSIRPASVVKHL